MNICVRYTLDRSSSLAEYLTVFACRHDSFSNSENSLDQRSSEDAHRDIVPSPLYTDSSSSSMSYPSPCLLSHSRMSNPPFSAPCSSMSLPCSSSSPLPRHCATSVFQFDTFDAATERLTPPPLPPKPNHVPDHFSEDGRHRPRAMSARHFPSHCALFPRRTSVSSLDHFRPGTHFKNKKSFITIISHTSTTHYSNHKPIRTLILLNKITFVFILFIINGVVCVIIHNV